MEQRETVYKLYKDASKAKEAAQNMKITAQDLKKLGVIDDIIKEPKGGAQEDFEKVIKDLKQYILKNIEQLQKCTEEKLLQQRYEKFRKI